MSTYLDKNFRGWDVRLIWTVTYPSSHLGGAGDNDFEIYGVDRSSISISRNLTRITSLEDYGQGWLDGVPDIRVTVLEKESGPAFEVLRRLSAMNIPFDVSLSLIPEGVDNHVGDWMDGYEKFLGCRVVNERTNYNIAEIPVREFECGALMHVIAVPGAEIVTSGGNIAVGTIGEIVEGDGKYSTTVFNLTGGA